MKKILLLTQNFPPIDGGSCRWFWELYSRLPKEQIVVAADNVSGAQAFDKTHSITVERISLYSPEWGVKSITGLKFYWQAVRQVHKLVKKHNIDEIHCGRVIHEGVIAWLLKLLTGTPFKCFVHGEDVETAATSREQSLLVKQVGKHSELIVCNSENSFNLVAKFGFAAKDKCRVLHPGVDVEKFKPAPTDAAFRNAHGWQDKFVLLTVGRLQRRKGQDYLVQAMPELLKHIPNLHYAIVGRGECEAELRQSIADNSLQDHVSLHTDFDDEQLLKAYQQCDMFILPNRTIGNDIEGFGMVLIEAQACGKFVIAGDSGGTREAMNIGKTGIIIDCSSVALLIESLKRLLQNNSEIATAPSDIREFADNSFSWQQHIIKARTLGLVE